MATTRTANLKLGVPALADRGWGPVMGANLQTLDASPLGALAVTPAQVPSASLQVVVAPGAYRKTDGSPGALAVAATLTLPATSTRVVYLDVDGVATAAAAYPAGSHVRLATVTTDASTVTSIVDDRPAIAATGDPLTLAYTLTYATADRTLAAYTPSVRSAAFTGQGNGEAGTVYAKVADLNALRSSYETIRAHAENTAKMLVALVQDLQSAGVLK